MTKPEPFRKKWKVVGLGNGGPAERPCPTGKAMEVMVERSGVAATRGRYCPITSPGPAEK